MSRWQIIGRLIEKLDKNKKWLRIRKYVASKIIKELSSNR